MKKMTAALISTLFLFAVSTTAIAQDEDGMGLTCADIDFVPSVTSRASDVDLACRDVVELNGARYAKFKVELLSVRGNSTTFHFIYPDGTTGSRHSITVDPSWRATIEGRQYRMSQLARGQELSVYLPSDRWEAHVDSPTSTFVAYTPAPMYAPDDMLPSTAGPLPLIGLFGILALLGASLIRIFRTG